MKMEAPNGRVLVFDDDSNYMASLADELVVFLDQHNIALELAFDLSDLKKVLEKTDAIDLAIVDLWITEKDSNFSDQKGGLKAIKILREHSPKVYIFVLSGHLTPDVRSDLEAIEQKLIANKPLPSRIMEEEIRYIMEAKGKGNFDE